MKHHILTRAAVGATASLAVIAPLAGCSGKNALTSSPGATSPATSTPSARGTSSSATYADGTYTARGVYGGAPSYMDFTITLKGGVITDVTSKLMRNNNDTSRGYQERFAAAVPDEVEGKSIDGLEVGVIAGASGCADGFNDALDKIRDEASVNN